MKENMTHFHHEEHEGHKHPFALLLYFVVSNKAMTK